MPLHVASQPILDADARELDRILRGQLITSLYQPIVDLESGETVGYESLARGPKESPLAFPDRMFATARAADRLAELDWECRAAALRGALENGLVAPMLLFVNVEPEAAFVRPPDHLWPLLAETQNKLRIVCEFTERGLIDRPADVLAAARIWRNAGMSVAIDDVSTDQSSLALLPYLCPEIIKLDLSVVQSPLDANVAAMLQTVNAWAEKTDAIVLAEGVETDEHLERAKSLGADFAQGWKYGKPLPLTDFELENTADGATLSFSEPRDFNDYSTPYKYVAARRRPRVGDKRMLLALSRQLETVGSIMGPAAIVISSFQSAKYFDPGSRERYGQMAGDLAIVGAIGADMPVRPAAGVRGLAIAQDDPLTGEWIVCMVSPHYGATLVAHDLGDTGPELQRRFNFCLTHDREISTVVMQQLIERLIPAHDRAAAPPRLRLAT
ncbi:MAG: EAL domain-containing protein [Solirubrobacterales bacterium]